MTALKFLARSASRVSADDRNEVRWKMNGSRAAEFLMAITRTTNEFKCWNCSTASSIVYAVTRVFHQIALLGQHIIHPLDKRWPHHRISIGTLQSHELRDSLALPALSPSSPRAGKAHWDRPRQSLRA